MGAKESKTFPISYEEASKRGKQILKAINALKLQVFQYFNVQG